MSRSAEELSSRALVGRIITQRPDRRALNRASPGHSGVDYRSPDVLGAAASRIAYSRSAAAGASDRTGPGSSPARRTHRAASARPNGRQNCKSAPRQGSASRSRCSPPISSEWVRHVDLYLYAAERRREEQGVHGGSRPPSPPFQAFVEYPVGLDRGAGSGRRRLAD